MPRGEFPVARGLFFLGNRPQQLDQGVRRHARVGGEDFDVAGRTAIDGRKVVIQAVTPGCNLLLRGEVGAWSVEIWKRFRKWGGIPTGITQNIKDLLASPEIENIFENSDFVYLLNQASGDRKILCERLNISKQQAAHISNSGPGQGLIFFGNVILPFVDNFPKDNELYAIMTTKPGETQTKPITTE